MGPNGSILDEVSYANQTTDISYGRYPDGTGNFQAMSPTFDAENIGTTTASNQPLENLVFKVYPNPAHSTFYLELNGQGKKTVSVFNLNGTVVHQGSFSEIGQIDVSDWPTGMCIVRVENSFMKIVVD